MAKAVATSGVGRGDQSQVCTIETSADNDQIIMLTFNDSGALYSSRQLNCNSNLFAGL